MSSSITKGELARKIVIGFKFQKWISFFFHSEIRKLHIDSVFCKSKKC